MTDKTPNRRLTELLASAGLSYAGLALRVNREGDREGLSLTCRASSVAHWVNESRAPRRPAVRRIVLAVLSGKLGRTITAVDVGWPCQDDALDPVARSMPCLGLAEVYTVLPALWSADMLDRRNLLASGAAVVPFSPAVLDYLTARPDRSLAHRGTVRVGRSDVQFIRDATTSLRNLDEKYGGGRVRPTAVAILHDHATPLLRGSYTDAVGRELWSAVGELQTLAGWLTFDVGQDALAQRYYFGALRLARGAGDARLAGYVFMRMSYLALRHRRGDEAVRLSSAAVSCGEHAGQLTERMRTEYLLVRARGHAVSGDVAAMRGAIYAAERAWARGACDDDPRWIARFDRAELHGAASHACADAGLGVEGLAHASVGIAERDAGRYARSLAMTHLHRANCALSAGDADMAVDAARTALDLTTGLSSARMPDRLRHFDGRLRATIGKQRSAPFTEVLRTALST